MHPFEIEYLDHVAIFVKDIDFSTKWYQEVLGLKKYIVKEWGKFPVFMLAGKTGIAIFPAKLDDEPHPKASKNVQIEHFAFNVSRENFDKARDHFNSIGINYEFQDHFHFHSIYINDPDGHKIEFTTLISKEEEYYDL